MRLRIATKEITSLLNRCAGREPIEGIRLVMHDQQCKAAKTHRTAIGNRATLRRSGNSRRCNLCIALEKNSVQRDHLVAIDSRRGATAECHVRLMFSALLFSGHLVASSWSDASISLAHVQNKNIETYRKALSYCRA